MTTTGQQEELSLQEIYREINICSNLHGFMENEKEIVIVGERFGRSRLYDIEKFVTEIIKTKLLAFEIIEIDEKEFISKELPLRKFLNFYDDFHEEYSEEKIFSPNVTLFFNASKKINPTEVTLYDSESRRSGKINVESAIIFNLIINEIRTNSSSQEFKKKVYAREYGFKRNFDSAKKYVDDLFSKNARLLVLRLDLGFITSTISTEKKIELKEAQNYLKKFLNNKRSKSIFDDSVGYIWKMEHGIDKGYHFHLFFFFDGSKRQKDGHIAQLIGEFWKTVTKGVGCFYNCNYQKKRYEKFGLGIGMINHGDTAMRENILKILHYFFKKEQYVKQKLRKKDRTFGKGELQKSLFKKRGRHRIQQ